MIELLVAMVASGAIGVVIGLAWGSHRRLRRARPADDEYVSWLRKDRIWQPPCKRADIPPGQELKKGWLGRRPWKPRPQDVLDEPRAIKGGR